MLREEKKKFIEILLLPLSDKRFNPKKKREKEKNKSCIAEK
jgi:hypothetical protein